MAIDFKKLREKFQQRDLCVSITRALDKGVEICNAEKQHVSSGFFNVSDLGYCLRKIYYKHVYKEEFPPTVLKKFAAGVDSGKRVVKFLQRAGILFGQSWCPGCGKSGGPGTVPVTCPHCGRPDMQYSEIGIRNLSRKISGKIDALVKHQGKVVLIEAKSSSTHYKVSERKNIESKLSHNIHQGNMYVGMIRSYLRAVDRQNNPKKFQFFDADLGEVVDGLVLGSSMDTHTFVMLYEDKNSNLHHPHQFPYNHDMYLQDLANVKRFWKHLETKTPPPRDEDRKNCRFCDYAERCNRGGS